MTTVNVRKQGGAAIMTIPSEVLKVLKVSVGSTLALEASPDSLVARPLRRGPRRRYTLPELLRGVTRRRMDALAKQTAWARAGRPVGRELP
jgi:antitoxin ChpS